MSAYFTDCKTAEDVKKEYHRLAMLHHPDRGGSEQTMKEINAAYDKAFDNLKTFHQSPDGKTYEKQTDERPEEFREIIEKIINLPGIKIEICGRWIWVTGDTRAVKDSLKALHFQFSAKKAAWYWHRAEDHKKSGKQFSLDQIRGMFGSEEIESNPLREIAAAV